VDAGGRLLEMQVFLPETPPSVQQTIQSKVAGAKLGDITKNNRRRRSDLRCGNDPRRFGPAVSASAPTGSLLEEQVFLEEAPETVRKAIQSQASRGRLGEINKSTDNGEVVYEAKLTIGRKLHSSHSTAPARSNRKKRTWRGRTSPRR